MTSNVGVFQLAKSNASVFANAKLGDVLVRTNGSNKCILIGPNRNGSNSVLYLSSNLVRFDTDIEVANNIKSTAGVITIQNANLISPNNYLDYVSNNIMECVQGTINNAIITTLSGVADFNGINASVTNVSASNLVAGSITVCNLTVGGTTQVSTIDTTNVITTNATINALTVNNITSTGNITTTGNITSIGNITSTGLSKITSLSNFALYSSNAIINNISVTGQSMINTLLATSVTANSTTVSNLTGSNINCCNIASTNTTTVLLAASNASVITCSNTTVSTSNLYTNLIGVNTVSPTDLLHVDNGRIRVHMNGGSEQLKIVNLTGQSEIALYSVSENSLNKVVMGIDSSVSRGVYIQTHGTDRITIMPSTGFVGIGVSNPEQRLDVDGAIAIRGTSIFDTNRNIYGASLTTSNIVCTDLSCTELTTQGGSINAGALLVGAISSQSINTQNNVINTGTNGVLTSSLTFNNYNLNTSFFMSNAQFVGLNNTTNVVGLHVSGRLLASNAIIGVVNTLGAVFAHCNNFNSFSYAVNQAADGSTTLNTAINRTLGFAVNGSTFMTLNSTGLDIANAVTINGRAFTDINRNIQVTSATGQGFYTTPQSNTARQAGGFYLSSDRSFGIELQSNLMTYVARNSTGGFHFKTVNSTYSAHDSGTSLLLITTSGSVGVGTTTPNQKLHVNGNAQIDGDLTLARINASNALSINANVTNHINLLNPSLASSNVVSVGFGKASQSNNNFAYMNYFHAADNSSNNQIRLGLWGNQGTVSITSSNVGINTFTPNYPLHVAATIGNVSVYADGDVACFSDQRKKINIQKIDSALDKIMQINGYTFNHIDKPHEKRMAGVLAQEVIEVLPEVVSTDQDGFYNVSYGNVCALLINAIKELQVKVDALTNNNSCQCQCQCRHV